MMQAYLIVADTTGWFTQHTFHILSPSFLLLQRMEDVNSLNQPRGTKWLEFWSMLEKTMQDQDKELQKQKFFLFPTLILES